MYKLNVKVFYLVENDAYTMKCRVRFSESTLCIFEKSNFVKIYNTGCPVFLGCHQHPPGCEHMTSDISPDVSTADVHWHFNSYHIILSIRTISLLQNLIITLQKSPSICFWLHPWFVPDSSKLHSADLSYQQGFVVQFPGTPDLPNLSAIWISLGPWNRKFSAPSSPSSKLENCVHPPKIALNLGFVRRKVFLRKGVRPAPVPFPLFWVI